MTEIHSLAIASKTPAPIITDLIAARRLRLLIDLDFSPELSAEILTQPYLYHQIVGARDPGHKFKSYSPEKPRHNFGRAA